MSNKLITTTFTLFMLLATSGVRNIWEAPQTQRLLADFLRQESIQPRSTDCHPGADPKKHPKQAEM